MSENRRGTALLAALAVVTAALVGVALTRHGPTASGAALVLPTPTPAAPVVAFLGDSYTGGSDMGGNGAAGWPAILAAKRGWDRRMFAVGGSGYINPGLGKPYADRVAAVIAAHPAMIFIEGSRNDIDYSPADVRAAADAVLRRLQRALPQARLIIIGPIMGAGTTPRRIVALSAAIREVALAYGAQWLDPADWFTGSYANLIGADGIHPTDQGHARMAQLIDGQVGQG